ncbi:hypothetical protein [Dialister succinatiphilus]|uniref:Uncharacterized protein n=1 Tax=Dialister succinatiphilus YIT 11850 TaxID=742743 RepID=H1D2R9_9FIRM|nr:hypothetical protein [Dialister succinatiphilus]EHO62189.1 hypothetical protein HMPREF9453_01907 [Dialister succinatiphilus YIT 11850]
MKNFNVFTRILVVLTVLAGGTANADFSPAPGTHYEVMNFDVASSLTVTSPVDGVFSASGDDAFITTERGKIVSFNNIDQ